MKKFLLKLLMGASLTASVFVFQACYGTVPPEEIYDMPRTLTEAVPDTPSAAPDAETVETETEVSEEALD